VPEHALDDLGPFLQRQGFVARPWFDGRHVDDAGRINMVFDAGPAVGGGGDGTGCAGAGDPSNFEVG
jgi:hypothetical protein